MGKNKFFNKIGSLIKGLYSEVTTYWKKPKPGEYVSYKEFTYYVLGASGCNGLGILLQYLSFGAGCALIGKIYEIPMTYFAILGILGIPMTYLASPINMLVQDNLGEFDRKKMTILHSVLLPLFAIGLGLYFVPQHYTEFILPALPQVVATIICTSIFNIYYRMGIFKYMSTLFGKFRPFVLAGLFPFLITMGLIIFLPFDRWDTTKKFWILHLLFSLFNIFVGFQQQTGNIGAVISPSSEERTKIMSIGGFVFSLAPSIVGIFLPIFVGMTGGFENLKTYRVVFPVFAVVLSVLGLFLAFGVKERIIVSKTHRAKINFGEGAKIVLSNKNYLAMNFANFFIALQQGAVGLNSILFIYISRNSAMFGVYAGIIGTACIPGLLLAPWLIKKFGKKNLVLFARVFSIAGAVLTYFAMMLSSTILFIVINYVVQVAIMPAGIATQSMSADVWDELQLKSGQRLDGMAGIFGLLQTPFYALCGLLMPALYLLMGFTSDWNILYVPELRSPIVNATVWIGVAVAVLGTIPYFFYDLTEKKHKLIMEQLKATAEGEGGFADEKLEESATASTKVVYAELAKKAAQEKLARRKEAQQAENEKQAEEKGITIEEFIKLKNAELEQEAEEKGISLEELITIKDAESVAEQDAKDAAEAVEEIQNLEENLKSGNKEDYISTLTTAIENEEKRSKIDITKIAKRVKDKAEKIKKRSAKNKKASQEKAVDQSTEYDEYLKEYDLQAEDTKSDESKKDE